jgi:MFS family permease
MARDASAAPPSLRDALSRPVRWLALAAFLSYLAVTGLAFLVALHGADEFGLSATTRGLILATFGLAGVVASPVAGRLIERIGEVRVAAAGALTCAATVPLLGVAGTPELLTAAWLGTGLGSALLWTGLNTITVEAAPANRDGAVSFVGAWKFAGNAAGPAVWLPLYGAHAWLAFAVAGAVCAAVTTVIRQATRALRA